MECEQYGNRSGEVVEALHRRKMNLCYTYSKDEVDGRKCEDAWCYW